MILPEVPTEEHSLPKYEDKYEKAHRLAEEVWGFFAPSVEEYRKATPNADGSVNPWDAGPACEWTLRKRFYEDTVEKKKTYHNTISFGEQVHVIEWLTQNKNNLLRWKMPNDLTVLYEFNEVEKMRREIQEFFKDKRVDVGHLFRAYKVNQNLFQEFSKQRITGTDDIRYLCHCEDDQFTIAMLKNYQDQIIPGDLDYPILANRSNFLKLFAENAPIHGFVHTELLCNVIETQSVEIASIWLRTFHSLGNDRRILFAVISRTNTTNTILFDYFNNYIFSVDDIRYAILSGKKFLIPKMMAKILPNERERAEKMLEMF